ncbi:LysM peptidoglycan-binding domain-containing protein [Pseudomonas sp. CR3202]|uniref:LysM peptidoglycan-binding domain-containing protein n=1 Tax=Pseudomonas sp. CR3202 TaxID=3351532 RepID=UPI003BF28820
MINQGDTLASIAQAVWGDAKMWYLIADANGLDPSQELTPGDSLKIPNVVSSTHNDATTFKPYDPDAVIGDTTPSPKSPPPPKPKKKKCNKLASVAMVVVAVVVSFYTGFLATPVLGSIGGTVVGSVGGTIVGAMAGSAASQLTGKALGVVDSFSLRQVAATGITAGLTSGLDALATAGQLGRTGTTASNILKEGKAYSYAAQGAANYVGSQIGNRIAGLETSFSWRNMAASAIGAAVAGKVNGGSGLVSSTTRGLISAHASAAMRDKWFVGDKPDYAQVAADAFGNALADFVVDQGVQTKVREVMDQAGITNRNDRNEEAIENLVRKGHSVEKIVQVLKDREMREVLLTQVEVLKDGRLAYHNEWGASVFAAPEPAPIEASIDGIVTSAAPTALNPVARVVNQYGDPLVRAVSAVGEFAERYPEKAELYEIAAQGAYYVVAGPAAFIKDQVIDHTIGPIIDQAFDYAQSEVSRYYQENGVLKPQADLVAGGTLFVGAMAFGSIGKGVEFAKDFNSNRKVATDRIERDTPSGSPTEVEASTTVSNKITATRENIVSGLGETVQPHLKAISDFDADALVGFRGSLARGFKGPHKENAPFDPQNFDVDAFIVSDKIASQFGSKVKFRSGSVIDGLAKVQGAIDASLRQNPVFSGLRDESFTFRIFTHKEIQNLQTKPDAQYFFIKGSGQ